MQTDKELDFRTKISKLVWDYALPGIVGTMVNVLYNVVDRIFIGQGVGALAISGLAITFPVINLTSSLGMLVGAGAAARISISLGKQDKLTAEQILGNSLLLTVVLNAIFITLFMIYLDPILVAFGASELTLPYARGYLEIVLLGNVFVSLCYNFNAMMRASGYPKKAMITMLIGAILNVILTPLFLFGFNLGMPGVAWSTVISMFIGMLFVMRHFTGRTSNIRLRWKNVRFNKKIILSILSIGFSPFSMQVAASGVAVLMNTSLMTYGGDLAVGAYGIINTIMMLLIMSVMGLNQGTQPIIGYNYGARDFKRVRETFYYLREGGYHHHHHRLCYRAGLPAAALFGVHYRRGLVGHHRAGHPLCRGCTSAGRDPDRGLQLLPKPWIRRQVDDPKPQPSANIFSSRADAIPSHVGLRRDLACHPGCRHPGRDALNLPAHHSNADTQANGGERQTSSPKWGREMIFLWYRSD